ncbi:hypothetical protein [Sciscionella marina]|uniref:hypothetical protein n=1 Tax=Sciscionella marina TaxID=508770 RepID=UPI000373D643|nr:hypothetical protein [Sciscionella marina]
MSTIRIADRELREAAYRALRALAVSHGEAVVAAELVLAAELFESAGLSLLLREIRRLPAGAESVGFVREGEYAVLADEAGRGPLLLGPLAAELALGTGNPVVLQETGIGPALAHWTAHTHATPFAVAVARHGAVTERFAAGADGTLVRVPVHDSPAPQGIESGLVLTVPDEIPDGARISPDTAGGIHVNAADWRAATEAASRFLVPENTPDNAVGRPS